MEIQMYLNCEYKTRKRDAVNTKKMKLEDFVQIDYVSQKLVEYRETFKI